MRGKFSCRDLSIDCRPSCWETPSPTCSRFRVQGWPTVKYRIKGSLLPAIMENQMDKKSETDMDTGIVWGIIRTKERRSIELCRKY